MLTRLDDKLDELDAAGKLTVKQLQEEEYAPGATKASAIAAAKVAAEAEAAAAASTASAANSSEAASSSGATVAAAPASASPSSSAAASSGNKRRFGQPLAGAVRDLTWQWCEGFVALATEGDPACMFIVAQMALAPGGYGRVKPNREKGLFWLFRAIEHGDLEARAYARRAARADLLRWLVLKDLDEAAAARLKADETALQRAMDAMSIKEDQVERDEKKLAADRDAEFGE
jgi:hypothetical protein